MVVVRVSSVGKIPGQASGVFAVVKLPGTLETVTIHDVKVAVSGEFSKMYPERQKIMLVGDRKGLRDDSTLKAVGAEEGPNGVELTVKDLGPQVSWRTVFLVEYAGPLVIHPLIYNLPKLFYGGPVQHSVLQKYVYGMVLFHFLKREAETVFVHRFSNATMPARNIIKNSAHYHLLSGVALAYAIYGPKYGAASPNILGTRRDDPRFLGACLAVWAFAEISNLANHITLRNLRPPGTRIRAIPKGYGFNLVSCPNYTFEVLAWAAVAAMSGSLVAWGFTAVSAWQMTTWAIKKHRNYKKEFGDKYPRGRKAIVPFLL